jgi:hypothetical protein
MSRQHEGQPPGIHSAADAISELLVDARGRGRGIAKGAAAIDSLKRHGDATRGQELVGAGLEQALRPLARSDAVIPSVRGNLD